VGICGATLTDQELSPASEHAGRNAKDGGHGKGIKNKA